MIWRVSISVSLALNLFLACALSTFVEPPERFVRTERRAFTRNAPVRPKNADIESNSRIQNTVTTNPVNSAFHWSQLQDPDWRMYRTNLQNFGCPPEVVRSIVARELKDGYLKQRREILTPFLSRYWDIVLKDSQDFTGDSWNEVRRLEKELDLALTEIGGTKRQSAFSTKILRYRELSTARELSFLSEEKRQSLSKLDSEFKDANRALAGDDEEELRKELQSQHDQKTAELLTVDELKELKARRTQFARNPHRRAGFEATLEEMRTISEIIVATDPTGGTRPSVPEAVRAQQKEALQKFLGENRFKDYERATSGDFQRIYAVSRRYEQPVETAIQLNTVREEAMTAAQKVQNDPARSFREKTEALKEIQNLTQEQMRNLFGDAAFETYRHRGGEWLKEGFKIEEEE